MEQSAVLVVAQPLVQHLLDRQAGVEADEVGQRERPHGVVHAQLHHRVDHLRLGHTLHDAEDRLVDHRHQDAVGDKAGIGVDPDGRLAEVAGFLPLIQYIVDNLLQ